MRSIFTVQVLVLFWRLMQYASTSRRLGTFVRMVLEVTYELWPFFLFLGIVYLGFAFSLLVVAPRWGLTTADGELVSRAQIARGVFLKLYSMMYGGDFSMDLLIDPVIAIINGVYTRVKAEEEATGIRHKAFVVAEVEQLMPGWLVEWRDQQLLNKKYLLVVQSKQVIE
ncbi:hypothetical protein HYH03_003502 [Edaphochlamys debaryana]|uniref:Uncharacterized protein n=1 Tax=Edaphochlamys debaryana TaxID=47281 RepID=A0A836C4C7_9CHLO|nr:hypothetical protein HYH03_003502 [Edaphochlamys debaryana]|eukprot:KAG2498763.1 hypothetical protein HYH03_003502 [Edaphochlamys debaryana]